MNYLEAALRYNEAGLKVVPFWNGGDGKKAFPAGYAKYRTNQTPEDVRNLFSRNSDGLAILCVGGIEVIDIDAKHDPKGTIVSDLLPAFKEFGLTSLPCLVQKTKSGGRHIIYRCPNPAGNTKLACRAGEKEAMIETRGDGGLLFVAPTPGYEVVRGEITDVPALPEITQEQRDLLISVCRHFDETPVVQFETKVEPATKAAQVGAGKPSWEAYDEATDILAVMEHYGWKIITKRGDYIRMNRPNSKHSRGIDGSVIISKNIFYPFTSSEQFAPNKGYSPSSVYAVLECNGDYSRAAKELYKMGFGDRIQTQEEQQQAEVKSKLPALIEQAESTRFDFGRSVVEPKALLKYEGERTFNIAGRGMIGVFTGHEKSGKSFVGACIAAAGIGNATEVLNFSLDLDGGKMLWFDTEQSGFFFQNTQSRIFRQAGLSANVQHYSAYHLRRMSKVERLEVVEHYIYNTPDVSVVMIDGFVDLIADYNDLKSVQEYSDRLLKWSDERQILILGVLHLNKGDGKIRGHIGSELKNKCDFIINTTREGNQYTISNPTSRYLSFPDMDFTRDGDGMPLYSSAYNRTFGQPAPTATQFPASAPAYVPQQVPRMNESDIPF